MKIINCNIKKYIQLKFDIYENGIRNFQNNDKNINKIL